MATDFSASPNYKTYSPVAIDAANQYGIPTDLFLWQIGQESSWNPTAVNGVHVGIAQFDPATAADLGIDPTNPTAAIYGAAKYDAQLYSKSGDWNKVLASYGTVTSNSPTSVQSAAQNIVSKIGSASFSALTFGFPFSRVVAILLGLICLIAALLAFTRIPQNIIAVGKDTAKGAIKNAVPNVAAVL